FMALCNLGRAWGAGLVGPMKENMNWSQIYITIAIIPFVMLLLIQFINFIKHQKSIDRFVLEEKNVSLVN
ncbi:MAG: hypothetical protein KDC50_08005, partial [Flavobacterium sp.]|nr:hypothetical protein [Flavobacterium sp.]